MGLLVLESNRVVGCANMHVMSASRNTWAEKIGREALFPFSLTLLHRVDSTHTSLAFFLFIVSILSSMSNGIVNGTDGLEQRFGKLPCLFPFLVTTHHAHPPSSVARYRWRSLSLCPASPEACAAGCSPAKCERVSIVLTCCHHGACADKRLLSLAYLAAGTPRATIITSLVAVMAVVTQGPRVTITPPSVVDEVAEEVGTGTPRENIAVGPEAVDAAAAWTKAAGSTASTFPASATCVSRRSCSATSRTPPSSTPALTLKNTTTFPSRRRALASPSP